MFHPPSTSISSSSANNHVPLRHQPHYLHVNHHHNHNYTISRTDDCEEIEEIRQESNDNAMGLDDAIELNSKIGIFHYRILVLCGLAFMSDSLEVNLLAFLSTCAGVEWSLSYAQKASITGVVFCGIILGSALWGVVSDLYGRKVGFILATLVVSIGGFFTSIATSYGVLLFCRAIVGIGIGGTNVPFDLLAELMPAKRRGAFLVAIQYFWAIGSMMVSGLAWLLLDRYGWRILALITVIPVALTAVVSILYLPESPRWLLSVGKIASAEKVLQDAAELNGVYLPPSFQLRPDDSNVRSHATGSPSTPSTNTTHLHNSAINYFSIIRDRHIRNIALPLWIVWGAFGFTYYGIILFVSRLYTTSSESGDSCSFNYSSIFFNAFSEIFSVTINLLLLESFGRVRMQTMFYALGGITVFLMGFDLPTVALILVGMIGRTSVFTSSNATWVATPELFATEYRAFGHATCLAISKLGAFLSPYVVMSHLSPMSVGIILCMINFLASVAAARLPETAGVQLDAVDEETSSHRSHRYEDTEGSSSHRHRQRVLLEEERKDFDHNETFQADNSLMLEMASSLPNGKSTLSVKHHAHHQLSQSVPIPVTNDEVVINPVFSKVL